MDEKGDTKELRGSLDSVWPGLPNTVDAAFTWTNGLTYIFRGQSGKLTRSEVW